MVLRFVKDTGSLTKARPCRAGFNEYQFKNLSKGVGKLLARVVVVLA
jgi:hypothetical protein